jgi:uncharacterized protein (TIRG00374 family)
MVASVASGEVRPAGEPSPGPVDTNRLTPNESPPAVAPPAEPPAGAGRAPRRSRWRIVWHVGVVLVAALSLQLLAPTLVLVYTSLVDVGRIHPLWLIVITACEAASFVCMWELTRIALRGGRWRDVARSQLVGNAASLVIPGGAATGVAVQMRILTLSGMQRTVVASSLPVVALLTTATVFAIPVFAFPAVLAIGTPPGELVLAVAFGAAGALLLGGVLATFLMATRPIEIVGTVLQETRNRLLPRRAPVHDLPQHLLHERDRIRRHLGQRWTSAVLMSLGKVGFDYFALLAALAAVGATPNPALVLVAFAAAQVLRMIPITPGGLGFVEAGLTGTLAIAGVETGHAVLATAAYRLVSYLLPVVAGAVAYVWFTVERRTAAPVGLGLYRFRRRRW